MSSPRQRWILPTVFGTGFALGLLGMWWLQPASPTAARMAAGSTAAPFELQALADSVARLEQQLAEQQATQQALLAQVADLSSLDAWSSDPAAPPATADAALAVSAPPTLADRRGPGRQPVDPALRRERLLAAGAAAGEADAVIELVDGISLQRAELRYRAEREGWLRSRRYFEARQALPDPRGEVREAFGEAAYDRYLYASGQPNRVKVRAVLRNSAAEQSGLQAGDLLLSVDGQRVYGMRDIRQVSRTGQDGELIPVEVQRGGDNVALYLPRGPLGIQADSSSVNPGDPTG